MSVKQDRQGARTPTDIERRYKLGRIDETDKRSASNTSKINQLNQTTEEKLAAMDAEIVAMRQSLEMVKDLCYPVGSIYVSVNPTNPKNLFGGTWERIQDTFLLAAGETYEAGSTGGEAEHTLTVEEMPAHSHSFTSFTASGSTTSSTGAARTTKTDTTSTVGGSQPHNNMPPYLAVYVWKRTA